MVLQFDEDYPPTDLAIRDREGAMPRFEGASRHLYEDLAADALIQVSLVRHLILRPRLPATIVTVVRFGRKYRRDRGPTIRVKDKQDKAEAYLAATLGLRH